MAKKPNYGFDRRERERLKSEKKAKRAAEKEEGRDKSGRSRNKSDAFKMFNVTYEDGTITSNRRVDSEHLDQSFGDSLMDLAEKAIQDQDDAIAQISKRPRGKIKLITEA